MITSVTSGYEGELRGKETISRLNSILLRIAAAYSDDPGTSDLDDEQSVYPVTGLTLGDVRLARRLVRTGCVSNQHGRKPAGTVNIDHEFAKSGDINTCVECGFMRPQEG